MISSGLIDDPLNLRLCEHPAQHRPPYILDQALGWGCCVGGRQSRQQRHTGDRELTSLIVDTHTELVREHEAKEPLDETVCT